ncbi:MAG: sugar phosphate isomerase/epimerase family protein [Saccharofermentanales bacterium]
MKYAVSSYSFEAMIQDGSISQFEAIALAKQLGFDAIEFAGLYTGEGETKLDYAARIKAECATQGIEVAAYAVGADFLRCPQGDLAREIEAVKEEVLIADALGTNRMRHDVSGGFLFERDKHISFDRALQTLADCCREITVFAASHGVRTMVENHGFYCQNSADVERLIDRVGDSNFGALIDIGNFSCVDEDCGVAAGRLLPYAFHVHIKDFHIKSGSTFDPGKGWFLSRGGNYLRGAIVGHGDVPVLSCLRLLKRSGYDEVLTLEFEGMEHPMTGIKTGIENLKRMMAER